MRDHRRLGVAALPLRGLFFQDVAGEGVAAAPLALGGQLEAFLGARMGLHLRHCDRRVKQTRGRQPRCRARSTSTTAAMTATTAANTRPAVRRPAISASTPSPMTGSEIAT